MVWAFFLEGVSLRWFGIYGAVIGALFILVRVCFQKYQFEIYQFEIYLLESVLQSFLTDGSGEDPVKES